MKITVVGCGNASSYINYNQSFLLEENGRRLLVDCGAYVPLGLHALKIPIESIDDIYISHQHADHCGGLENIAFLRYDWINRPVRFDDPNGKKNYAPRLICNELLMKELWEHTLKGGLDSIEMLDATLETYFNPMPIQSNKKFIWQGWEVSLVQQIHIMTGSVMKNAFGLFLERLNTKNDKTDSKYDINKIFFTTDAQYFQPEQIRLFYDKADMIFQDTECIGCDTNNKRMIFKSGAHANYAQLAGWPGVNAYKMDTVTRKKIWLSHYQDFVTNCVDGFGNPCDWDKLAEDDGFAGFIQVGQVFEI